MDETSLNNILKSQWQILPEDIKTLVVSPTFFNTTESIGRKYGLTREEINSLYNETFLVLVGLTHLLEYETNIEQEVVIPKEKAANISQEMGSQIFAHAKESLREISKSLEMQSKNQIPTTTVAQENTLPTNQTSSTQTPPFTLINTPRENHTPQTRDAIASAQIQSTTPETFSQDITMHGTVLDEKLSRIVKIPREEATVRMGLPEKEVGQPETQTEKPPQPSYTGTDPYREPLE